MANRTHDRQRQSGIDQESSGSVPAMFPPHPPLVSGGWYHGMSVEEVLGPGRYPVETQTDKSVGSALALTLLLGPAGLCYVSLAGGLVCFTLTAVALILFGPAPLLIAWPLSMVAAGIIASGQRQEFERR
jgi:hypothetical protein